MFINDHLILAKTLILPLHFYHLSPRCLARKHLVLLTCATDYAFRLIEFII